LDAPIFTGRPLSLFESSPRRNGGTVTVAP